MSDSLGSLGMYPTSFLHPWKFLGKSTGVGCHFLVHETFPTQGLNPGLPHGRKKLYYLSHQGCQASQIAQLVNNLPTIQETLTPLIIGSGSSPGEVILYQLQYSQAFVVPDSKESTYNMRELHLDSELRQFPGGGHGNPLQYTHSSILT